MPSELDEGLLLDVYRELRQIAARLLDGERAGHTLQPTALVHEGIMRLLGKFPGGLTTGEFLALSAHQMRRVLVDHARTRGAQKRGGGPALVPLLDSHQYTVRDEASLVGVNEALDRLGLFDPRALSVVELKFFSGHTINEIAEILGVSDGTVEADWLFARTWLFGALREKARV